MPALEVMCMEDSSNSILIQNTGNQTSDHEQTNDREFTQSATQSGKKLQLPAEKTADVSFEVDIVF